MNKQHPQPKGAHKMDKLTEALEYFEDNPHHAPDVNGHFNVLCDATQLMSKLPDIIDESIMGEPDYRLNKYDEAWCIGYQKGFDKAMTLLAAKIKEMKP